MWATKGEGSSGPKPWTARWARPKTSVALVPTVPRPWPAMFPLREAARHRGWGVAAAGDGEEGIEVVRPHTLIKMTNKIKNTDSHQNSRSPRRSPSPPSIAAVHLVDLPGRTGDCVPAAPATAPRGLIVVLCGCAPCLPRRSPLSPLSSIPPLSPAIAYRLLRQLRPAG